MEERWFCMGRGPLQGSACVPQGPRGLAAGPRESDVINLQAWLPSPQPRPTACSWAPPSQLHHSPEAALLASPTNPLPLPLLSGSHPGLFPLCSPHRVTAPVSRPSCVLSLPSGQLLPDFLHGLQTWAASLVHLSPLTSAGTL